MIYGNYASPAWAKSGHGWLLMLKSLIINNFRTWKKVVLNFCSGVNVIVGLPDSGKTNLLRAINWVNDNRPLGNRVQSRLTDDPVGVSIDTDEGTVTLEKKNGKNIYWLNDRDFKAVGQSVPDIIKEALNLSELNIQKQLDIPYLITSGPSEVIREIDKITRLESIEEWKSNLTSRINTENRNIKLIGTSIEATEKAVKEFGDLDSINKELEDLEFMQKTLDFFDGLIEKAERLKEEAQEQQKKLDSLKMPEGLLDKLDSALADLKEIEYLDEEILRAECVTEEFKAHFKNMQSGKAMLLKEIKEYKEYINKLDKCPYCEFCQTDIKSHSFEQLLEEYKI